MMTTTTLRTLSTLTTDETILSEINAELARLEKLDARKAEKQAAQGATYEAAHDVVMAVFEDTTEPLTVADIYESCEGKLPDGFTKNKLAYALRAYWADEVVKHAGKVNAYTKA